MKLVVRAFVSKCSKLSKKKIAVVSYLAFTCIFTVQFGGFRYKNLRDNIESNIRLLIKYSIKISFLPKKWALFRFSYLRRKAL